MTPIREDVAKEKLINYANDLMADWPSTQNRQKLFVLKYLENGFTNATDAAREAGYAERSADRQASRLLRNDEFKHVQSAVSSLQGKFDELATEMSIANTTEIMQYLTKVVRGEETDQTLVGVGEGAQTIAELRADTKDRIKAAELLGKSYGMWLDRLDAGIKSEITVEIGEWDDDEG